jgi:DNA processing protein
MDAASRGTITDAERLAWLRLIRTDNVGPVTFRELLAHFGSAEAALEAVQTLARRGGARNGGRVPSRGEAAAEIAAAEAVGARFVAISEPSYPPWLRHADGPPPLLCVRGPLDRLAAPSVAVVGARNASAAGRKIAALIAEGVGEAGFVIVSGLARHRFGGA